MSRIEHDLLGTRELPADVYYGIQTLRATENFPITGQRLHPGLVTALAAVKEAAARANRETGHIPAQVAAAIIQACGEVRQGRLRDQFVVDPIQGGAGTSINMNMNEVLANRANEILGGQKGEYQFVHPNNHVNAAQSTNDVVPTAVRVALLDLLTGAISALECLVDAFKAKESEFDQVMKLGRTHLQDAVPIRMGQEFGAYARVVARDVVRLGQARDGLYTINLGATAVGTGLNADPEYITRVAAHLREITGLPLRSAAHLVDATQNVDALVALSAAFKTSAVNLSKIANDLRLLASGPRGGLGEISLPPMQPGSSIMPGKVNPVMCEVVNQVAFQVIGNDLTVTLAAEAGQLELNVMQPVLVYNLIQTADIVKNVVTVFTEKAVRGLVANRERCGELLERTNALVTAMNPHLGYEMASQVAREALATGRSAREIVRERGLLTDEELDAICDPNEMTAPGIAGAALLGCETRRKGASARE